MENLTGQRIDRYQIVSALGESYWGSVYLAHDSKLDRTVVLQAIDPQAAAENRLGEYILQAGRTLVGWQHPGVARYYDLGKDRALFYIVREYIPGPSLAELFEQLRAGGYWLPLHEAVLVALQIAQTLEFSHQKGILHGALRPQSVLFRPSPASGSPDLPYQPLLINLGLVRPGAPLADSGRSVYSPPELRSGRRVDKSADIYAVGALLHELCTGQTPPQITKNSTADENISAAAPALAGLPQALAQVIARALAGAPEGRYQTISELASSLQRAAELARGVRTTPGKLIAAGLMPLLQKSLADSELPGQTSEHTPPDRTEVDAAARAISRDSIHILLPDQTIQSFPMKPEGLTLGRASDNDITIDQAGISRHHARIDFDGVKYVVSDLNSTNGTFIEESRLAAGESRPWGMGENLRLGEVWIRLERYGQAATTRAMFPEAGPTRPGKGLPVTEAMLIAASAQRLDGGTIETAQLKLSQGRRWVGAYLDKHNLSAAPGQSADVSIILFNQGPARDVFNIEIQGLPTDWISIPIKAVPVPPGGQADAQVIFRPPRSSQGRAGRHAILIRVSSQSAPDQVVELRLALTVTAFSLFASELRPNRVASGQLGQALVHNRGNLPETFTLLWEDRSNSLNFDPPQLSVNIEAGKSAAVEYRVSPQQPRWFGGESAHSFKVHVSSHTGQMQSHSGEFISRALIPAWAPMALLLLCISLTCVGLLFFNQLTAPARIARQTAAAGGTALAQATGQAALAETATALALGNANQATQQAATATAVWATSDDDQDGLANSLELLAGTLPDVADTDEDGLKDGDEVNTWKTDPIKADTDGDGLKDGREIEIGTNPLSADTDGDGLNDAVDPDPIKAPTATLFVPPTYTPRPPVPIPPTPTRLASPTPTTTRIVTISPTVTATATRTNTPLPQTADLTVSVSNGLPAVIPGNTVIYTIQVNNKGPGLVTNAQVVDNFPGGLSAVTWICSATPGSSCQAPSGSGNINHTVTLASGGTATFTASGSLSPVATGLLVNSASVALPAGVNDPVSNDNQATDSDPLTPKVNLSLTKTDGRASIFPGQSTSYTIQVSNSGPSAVNGVSVLDLFPSQLANVSWTCSAVSASCTTAGPVAGNITTLVNLGAGGTVTFSVFAQVKNDATGEISNTVSISSPIDPGTNNKTATDATQVLAQADLELLVQAPATITASAQLTYTIYITNSGPSAVTGLTLTHLLPADAILVASDPSAPLCQPSSGQILCSLGALPAGGSFKVWISVTAPASPGSLISVFDVKAAEVDPNPVNNTTTVTIPILAPSP